MALYRRKPKDTCRAGHPYTEENTVWISSSRTFDGKTRNCLICRAAKLARRPRAQATERMRRWRAANKERVNKGWRDLRSKKKAWIDSQKIKCNRCEQTHPATLEFHHKDPGEKDFLLSLAVARYSLERIQTEAAKCEVLCSNCHRIHHWNERNKEE